MKLLAYLERESISYAEFARRIGAHNARTVERHAKGQRTPNLKMMSAITRETRGEVQLDDFLEQQIPARALAA